MLLLMMKMLMCCWVVIGSEEDSCWFVVLALPDVMIRAHVQSKNLKRKLQFWKFVFICRVLMQDSFWIDYCVVDFAKPIWLVSPNERLQSKTDSELLTVWLILQNKCISLLDFCQWWRPSFSLTIVNKSSSKNAFRDSKMIASLQPDTQNCQPLFYRSDHVGYQNQSWIASVHLVKPIR